MTEGIVNILKPPGMTSSDAVADVRHIFKIKRVGHTGTLDPGAAGVLPPATSAMLHNLSTLGISLRSMTNLLPPAKA